MTSLLTAAAAAYFLLTPAHCQTPLACAIEHVESRGNTWAVSAVGARGLRQVMPHVARVPAWLLHVPVIGRAEGDRVLGRWMVRCGGLRWGAATGSKTKARHERRALVDGVSQTRRKTADRRMTPRRSAVKARHPANDQLRCALRAYACGNRALRDARACGRYADAVMAARGGTDADD
jgi:hypothetical protein